MRSRGKDGPPPLLLRLYGDECVLNLRQLLLRLSEQSPEAAAALRSALVQPTDHADYAQALLERTWCVLRPDAPRLRDGFTLCSQLSQPQLVGRAVEWLLTAGPQRRGSDASNVLCYGYSRKHPAGGGRSVPGMPHIESKQRNTTTASLCSPAWQLLLSRIGDTLMLYLLLNASMFAALPNSCCLQLSGPPISQVARAWKKAAPPAVAAAAARLLSEAAVPGPPSAQLRVQGREGRHETALTQQPGSTPADDQPASAEMEFDSAVHHTSSAPPPQQQAEQQGGLDVPAGAMRAGKAPRPSSWQRRRAAKLRQLAEQQLAAVQQGHADAMQVEGPTRADGSLLPTQEVVVDSVGQQDRGPASGDAATGRAGGPGAGPAAATVAPVASSNKRGPSSARWPARMPRPTDMLLQRSSIFYCPSFSRKPGLTSQHVLSKLKGAKDAERCLFAAIFDPKHSPVGRTGASQAAFHSAMPPPPRRIPAQQRHLLPLLRRLIDRSSKCPYGLLLQHHCPLPAQLREEQQRRRRGQHAAAAAALTAAPPLAAHHSRSVAAATPTAAAAPLPSQTALVQRVRRQRLGAAAEQEPAAGTSMDALMDELFQLEQQAQQAQQAQQVEQHCEAVPQAVHVQSPAGAHATRRGDCPARSAGVADAGLPPTQRAAAPVAAAVAAAAAPAVDVGAAAPGVQQGSLAGCFVPHSRVVAFVWSVVRSVVPAELLGDARSQRAVRQAISRFVRLRRYEQLSVHQVMHGLRPLGLPWLQPQPRKKAQQQQQQPPTRPQQQQEQRGTSQRGTSQHPGAASPASQSPRPCPTFAAAQQRRLALWLGWLFGVLVAPLLRAHFYCTESEAYRQQVFFYRKPVWAALAREATEELRQQQYAALPPRQALETLQGRRLGVARLRLLPKRSGIRFIVNLGRRSVVRFRGAGAPQQPGGGGGGGKRRRGGGTVTLKFEAVNRLLQDVYQVLRFEASCQPHLLGASVFGYHDTFCKLHPFLRKWRAAAEAEAAAGRELRPYIVSADVRRAFDSVSVPLLLRLLEPLLRHERYLVLKYWEVVPSLGQVKVIPRRLAAAEGPEGLPHFPALAARWAASHRGKAYTDQVMCERVSREAVLQRLRQHLTANLVRLRRAWCVQRRGIPQGSTLSTLLCSLYLAHLERTQLAAVLAGRGPPAGPHGAAAAATGMDWAAGEGQDWEPGQMLTSGGVRTGAPAGDPGEQVMLLGGGAAAAVAPAAVISLGRGGSQASASSSSRGLLSELARAAGSSSAHAPRPPASAATASPPARRAGKEGVASPAAPQRSRVGRPGGEAPTGDLLLLPAGASSATPAPPARAAGSLGPPAPQHGPAAVASPPPQRPHAASPLALHTGSLLLRLVDDFLLITAVPAVAQGFAARMLQGFEEHNVHINPDKTKLSFALQLAGGGVLPATVWRSADGATFVKWCGLLLNMFSLEVQGDYTRYSGEHISASLTLPLRARPGAQLAPRLCHYLRPKIHPLLLDATINSPLTVRLNIYQAFLLGAMKFHCYVAALPAAPAPGARVLLEAIETGIAFMASLTRRRRVASAHYRGLEQACCTAVPRAHVRWLGLTAFLRVLRRKQARYSALLSTLRELVEAPGLRGAARQLAPAVDPARNSVFDTILY